MGIVTAEALSKLTKNGEIIGYELKDFKGTIMKVGCADIIAAIMVIIIIQEKDKVAFPTKDNRYDF